MVDCAVVLVVAHDKGAPNQEEIKCGSPLVCGGTRATDLFS